MIRFKVFNDDKLRRWANFPTMKDPYVLENTLLRIINEIIILSGEGPELNFNILNPKIANMYFVYYTSSNFNAWGLLPLSYIYNDMVRHIQNQNTSNNFIMTLESITFDTSRLKDTELIQANSAYEIVSSYISENYLTYNLITHSNNGVMLAMVPNQVGITFYILAVGFDPFVMAKWYCTNQSSNDMYSLPYDRFNSLRGIIFSGQSLYVQNSGVDNPSLEMSDSKLRESINGCNKLVQSYNISLLKRKSSYDTEIKYGNFPLDYNILTLYDACKPAAYLSYTNAKGNTSIITRFNQPEEYISDYRVLNRQNDIIKIAEKRKEIGVGN